MHIIKREYLLSALALVSAVGATPNWQDPPVPVMVLSYDAPSRVLHFQSGLAGLGVLAVGPAPIVPIPIGDILLDVVPLLILPLGAIDEGDEFRLVLPAGLGGIGIEAVAVDMELRLHDSNTIFIEEVGEEPDLVERSFRSALQQEGNPPIYTATVSLTAPTSGYELLIDSVDLGAEVSHVYLRLVEPGQGEFTMQVLEAHAVEVGLGSAIGKEVHVHLMRIARGSVGPEVYRRMAILQPSSGPAAVK